MPISDKTRKILWGRSASRCAMCRHELVVDATPADDESVVGDECHVVSGAAQGPRHDPNFPAHLLDLPDNLLLLCRVHHKQVDDQHQTYTVERLKKIRADHEAWVATALSTERQPTQLRIRRVKGKSPPFLVRIVAGRDLSLIVGGAHGYSFDHEELQSQKEATLVGGFLQNLEDWLNIWNDIDSAGRVDAAFAMATELKDLEAAGFWVFGAREIRHLEGGHRSPTEWPIAIIQVVRTTSEEIVKVDLKTGEISRVTATEVLKT